MKGHMPHELPEIFGETVDLSPADDTLARLYEETGRSVDQLAYTKEFDRLYEQFESAGFNWGKPEVFRRLLVLRKAGLLPRIFRPSTLMPQQKSA